MILQAIREWLWLRRKSEQKEEEEMSFVPEIFAKSSSRHRPIPFRLRRLLVQLRRSSWEAHLSCLLWCRSALVRTLTVVFAGDPRENERFDCRGGAERIPDEVLALPDEIETSADEPGAKDRARDNAD